MNKLTNRSYPGSLQLWHTATLGHSRAKCPGSLQLWHNSLGILQCKKGEKMEMTMGYILAFQISENNGKLQLHINCLIFLQYSYV
jgi:hypothetical protein